MSPAEGRTAYLVACALGIVGCNPPIAEEICERYQECSLRYEGESSVAGCTERLQRDIDSFDESASEDLESALETCPDEQTCEGLDTCAVGLVSATKIAEGQCCGG